VDKESLVVCGILHDICKVNFYGTGTRNVKNASGQWERVPYITVDDKEPLGHGEKSVIIIHRFIPLTSDEQLAIRWHMGAWENIKDTRSLSQAISRCGLLRALMLADQMATFKEDK
jgi:hypothetical protein